MNEVTEYYAENEENAKTGSLQARSNNYELEKFKRRLIRAVARMLLHEKRNEDEVWTGLKKQTGCDCKELWSRMHALTMKKLDRLLRVQDEVQKLPKAARMSITDWLLFDTVLVHEEFDVIGIAETTKEDKNILVELFALVEKFQIEFLAGDNLAQAWTEATLYYNKDNRQCTPMLLQRRWYQLKLATRARFYKFWSIYKGVEKRIPLGEPYKPTPLQTTIAKRYKPLVVKPFMVWEDLLKHKLIVMPTDFERLAVEKQSKKVVEETVPDIVCLEPEVETIDVEDNSDGELEYRKEEVNNVFMVKIKEEPKDHDEMETDETAPYRNRQEKISHFAEAVMETTAMELDEIELASDIDQCLNKPTDNDDDDDALVIDEDNTTDANITVTPPNETENTSTEPEILNNDVIPVTTDEGVPVATDDVITEDDVISVPTDDVIPVLTYDVINISTDDVVPITTADVVPITTEDIIPVSIDENTTSVQNLVETERQDDIETPGIVLPQITSVFGGVDVSSDTLSKIGLLTAEITRNSAIVEGTTNIKADIEMSENNDCAEALHHEVDIKIEPRIDVGKYFWYNELPDEIDFADDGIELIEEEEFDDDYPKPIKTMDIEKYVEGTITKTAETVIEVDEQNEEEEVPKVDEKLLLIPTVATVKLDDMGILPLNLLEHIDNKALIDVICIKSKVVQKVVTKPEPELEPELELEPEPEPESEPDPEPDIEPEVMSDSCDDDIIQLPKRVKLSSTLLQKPRGRTYNTIQLCKNPDFNTRLKRLNAGFFSSRRNLLLLKACEPLTIDVSKAFENRLVNGTMYLKASDEEDLKQNIDLTENSQNVSVVPSAMVVQSLIDNTKGEITAVMYSTNIPKPVPKPQRNKVINLPDITEIRRINQNLLIAEVTPLQMNNSNPPVAVAVPSIDNSQKDVNSAIASPACLTRQPTVVDITDNSVNPGQPKNQEPVLFKGKIPPWRIRYKPVVPWYSSSNSVYSPDTLLALDTLNKMLYLLTNGDIGAGSLPKKKTPKFLAKRIQRAAKRMADDDDDVQLVGETKLDNAEAKKCRRKRRVPPKPVYCCWCREKICQSIFNKKSLSKHNCPFPLCLCCCKEALVNYYHKKREGEKKISIIDVPQPLGCINSALGLEYVGVEKERLLRQVPPQRPRNEPPPLVSLNKNRKDVAEIIRIVNDDQSTSSNPAEVETASETAVIVNNVVVSNSVDPAPNKIVCLDGESVNDNAVYIDDEVANVNHEAGNADNEPVDVDEETNNVEDESINELEPEMNDSLSDTSMVGAEVSVATSESSTSGVTKVTTATNTGSLPLKKPLIRVKLAETDIRKKIIYKNKVDDPTPPLHQMPISTQHIKVTSEMNKKLFLIIDPAKMVTTTVGSIVPREKQKGCSGDNTNVIRYYNPKLTKKGISEPSPDSPLYLGKDKILLSTARFPPNYKAFEEFQNNISQTLALPEGLQLNLSPSGQVTCKIRANAQISDVFMTSLPQLIEAIQQHIDQGISTDNRPVATCPVVQSKTNAAHGDVINLSDEETVTENSEDSSEDNVLEDNQNETTQTNFNIPVKEQENVISLNANDPQNSNTGKITAKQQQSPAIDNEVEKTQSNIGNLDSIEIISEHTELSGNVDVTQNSDTTEVSTHHTYTKTKNVEEGNENTNTNAVTTENPITIPITNTKATENDTAPITNSEAIENVLCSKPKNILSDLMAMSGIEEMDIALSQQTPSTTITQETFVAQSVTEPSLLQPLQNPSQDPPVELAQTSQDADVEQSGNNMAALSSINTISELRYAAAQNCIFFKLNLETGLLLPIKICLKNFDAAEEASKHSQTTSKSRVRHCRTYISKTSVKGRPSTIISSEPKPVIDLTDDDVCETVQPVEVQAQTLLEEPVNLPKQGPLRPRPAIQVRSLRSLLLSQISLSGEGTTQYSIDLNNDGDLSSNNVQVQKASQINKNLKPIKLLKRLEQPNISSSSNVQGVIEISQIEKKKLKSFKIIRKVDTHKFIRMSKLQDLESVAESCKEDTNVKPVALFKKAGPPNILRRKLKEIQKRIKDAMSVQDMIRRKLKRKQEFIPTPNQLMTVSSDSDSDEQSLATNQLMSVSSNSDADSDEEPLAKIATKMRESEKEASLKALDGNTTVEPSGENSNQSGNVPENANVSTAVDADMPVESLEDFEAIEYFQDDAEPSLNEDINMPIECLDEEFLQDDDTADDCILGV